MKPQPAQSNPEIDQSVLLEKVLAQTAFLLLMLGLALFLPAGRLNWLIGWVMVVLFVAGNSGTLLVLIFIDPGLAKERIEVPGEMLPWDRVLTGIPKVLLILIMLPLAGFDHRFGWSEPFPVGIQWAGLVVFTLSGSLISWAMLANRFFASTVRIQTERGHQVVSNGPYRFVRHPGYLGMIMQFMTASVALGAWWGVIPGFLAAVCYGIRTALEDRTLQKELAGYADYAEKVRYRLLPGVW